jgi:hypothetical protein
MRREFLCSDQTQPEQVTVHKRASSVVATRTGEALDVSELAELDGGKVRLCRGWHVRSKWSLQKIIPRTGRLDELAKNPRILLPFHKSTAVKSPPPGKMDNIIEAKELQIERKRFYVELRENERGKFLRITEEAHGRRNSIIVPTTGVDDFTAAIAEVLTNNEAAPA